MQLPAAVLIAPLNHVLSRNAWARERLRPHGGAIVEIHLDAFIVRLAIDHQGLFAADTRSTAPEVTITVPLSAVPRLAFDAQQNAMGAVRLAGNAELADTVAFVLRHLEWDIEADLAGLVGDIAAHRIVAGLRALAPVPRRAAESIADNLRDYLVEEQPLLVGKTAVGPVDSDVRRLRDDIARLEKRVDRLMSPRRVPARS